jgi:anti-anti-sigma factor
MLGTRARRERARQIMIEIGHSMWTQLQLVETCDTDGILHIALVGELDVAVADRVSSRLDQLKRGGTRARLDLSQLEFTDVSGVRTLMRAAQHRDRHGEQLFEIGHDLMPIVRRVIDLVGAAPILWPTNHAFR